VKRPSSNVGLVASLLADCHTSPPPSKKLSFWCYERTDYGLLDGSQGKTARGVGAGPHGKPRHLVSGPYRSGQFGWILEGPIRFKSPISAPGRLNLFKPDATLEASLEEAESFASGHSSSQT
jgi:hypothetical protein